MINVWTIESNLSELTIYHENNEIILKFLPISIDLDS